MNVREQAEYSFRHLLIVAKQGPLRDSMRALVTALPRIEIVDETDNISTALDGVGKHHPDLVLIEGDFSVEELWVFLRQIKRRSPLTRRLMIVDTIREKQEMEAPGVEAICLTGASPLELVANIEKLLMPSVSPTPT
jgi:DNA-binding NarL/FixJ family response regulator